MGDGSVQQFIQILLFAIAAIHNLASYSTTQAFCIAENNGKPLMERTVLALQKVMHYYKHNYDTININSLLGVRVTEGILQKLLVDGKANRKSAHNSNTKLFTQIRKMYHNAKIISTKSSAIVHTENMQAFQKFHKIISKPWQLFYPFQKLRRRNMRKPLTSFTFDGPMSDHCIALLLKDEGGQSSCNVTDMCWQFETQRNMDGYTATHQVLYFLFGQGEGCEVIFNKKFQDAGLNNGVKHFTHELCKNILQSADEFWHNSVLLDVEKDLFLEQSLVCSLAGYEDFLNDKYLDIILGWQMDIGCFGTQVFNI